MTFREEAQAVVDEIVDVLAEKNKRYGDSVLRPLGIFGSGDPVAGIGERIDDKLKRLQTSAPDDTEDAELDLIGYLVLRRMARARAAERP